MPWPPLDPPAGRHNDRQGELTLAELIDDPLIRLLMASDGVDAQRIRTIFGKLVRHREHTGSLHLGLAIRKPHSQPSAGARRR